MIPIAARYKVSGQSEPIAAVTDNSATQLGFKSGLFANKCASLVLARASIRGAHLKASFDIPACRFGLWKGSGHLQKV